MESQIAAFLLSQTQREVKQTEWASERIERVKSETNSND